MATMVVVFGSCVEGADPSGEDQSLIGKGSVVMDGSCGKMDA